MIACDCCHCLGITRSVARLRLTVLKPDPTSGRTKPEELHGVDVELCTECVPIVWSKVAKAAAPAAPGTE